jgi:hypothetical protein
MPGIHFKQCLRAHELLQRGICTDQAFGIAHLPSVRSGCRSCLAVSWRPVRVAPVDACPESAYQPQSLLKYFLPLLLLWCCPPQAWGHQFSPMQETGCGQQAVKWCHCWHACRDCRDRLLLIRRSTRRQGGHILVTYDHL